MYLRSHCVKQAVNVVCINAENSTKAFKIARKTKEWSVNNFYVLVELSDKDFLKLKEETQIKVY